MLAAGPARAQSLQVEQLYAEPDLRIEATAVTLLVRARLSHVEAKGRVSGWLRRVGVELVGSVQIRDGNDQLQGHDTARAPESQLDSLAAQLAGAIAARIQESATRSESA
ncbi:MAG: hypothetical protein MJE77_13575 [Proteobacteria bacterium]|nr:hypothetical protein [Pseudomonadota bacterium]